MLSRGIASVERHQGGNLLVGFAENVANILQLIPSDNVVVVAIVDRPTFTVLISLPGVVILIDFLLLGHVLLSVGHPSLDFGHFTVVVAVKGVEEVLGALEGGILLDSLKTGKGLLSVDDVVIIDIEDSPDFVELLPADLVVADLLVELFVVEEAVTVRIIVVEGLDNGGVIGTIVQENGSGLPLILGDITNVILVHNAPI